MKLSPTTLSLIVGHVAVFSLIVGCTTSTEPEATSTQAFTQRAPYKPYKSPSAYTAYKTEQPGSLCWLEPEKFDCWGTEVGCEADPDNTFCYGTEAYCRKNPNTFSCIGTEGYCQDHPRSSNCAGTEGFCSEKPTDSACVGTDVYCAERWSERACIGTEVYCERCSDEDFAIFCR